MSTRSLYLPPELRLQILNDLPQPALKAARLAGKYFSGLTDQLLFSDLILYPTILSFEKLHHISTHAYLATYVRSITYNGDLLPEAPKSDGKELPFDNWVQMLPFRPTPPHLDLEKYYCAYVYYATAQSALWKNRQAPDLLANIMRRLPNVDCLEFAAGDPQKSDPSVLNTIESIGSQCQARLITLLRSNSLSYMAQIKTLLHSANASGIKFMTFKAKSVPWRLLSQPESLQMMGIAARSLTHLHLTFEAVSDVSWLFNNRQWLHGRDNWQALAVSCLAKIIHSTNLSILELDFGEPAEHVTHVVIATGILNACSKLANLKRLKLANAAFSATALQQTLLDNAKSLKSLELGFINLMHPGEQNIEDGHMSWVSLLRLLRSTLKLDHISMDGHLHTVNMGEQW